MEMFKVSDKKIKVVLSSENWLVAGNLLKQVEEDLDYSKYRHEDNLNGFSDLEDGDYLYYMLAPWNNYSDVLKELPKEIISMATEFIHLERKFDGQLDKVNRFYPKGV